MYRGLAADKSLFRRVVMVLDEDKNERYYEVEKLLFGDSA